MDGRKSRNSRLKACWLAKTNGFPSPAAACETQLLERIKGIALRDHQIRVS